MLACAARKAGQEWAVVMAGLVTPAEAAPQSGEAPTNIEEDAMRMKKLGDMMAEIQKVGTRFKTIIDSIQDSDTNKLLLDEFTKSALRGAQTLTKATVYAEHKHALLRAEYARNTCLQMEAMLQEVKEMLKQHEATLSHASIPSTWDSKSRSKQECADLMQAVLGSPLAKHEGNKNSKTGELMPTKIYREAAMNSFILDAQTTRDIMQRTIQKFQPIDKDLWLLMTSLAEYWSGLASTW